MNMSHRSVYVLLMVLALVVPARAEVYRISPGSALAIGEGFDARQPRRVFLPCIDYSGLWATTALDTKQAPKPDTPYTTSAGFSFQSSEIESRKHLYEFVNISASVSGGYGFFSGSASFLSEDEFKFDEHSYHFAMRAVTEFGEFRLINPKLNAQAKEALARSPAAFFERCGTEFVGQQTRGASIAVVYSVYSLDQSKRSRIEASLKAGFDSGASSAGGNAEYTKILAEAIQTGTLKIHVYGFGGEGMSALNELVTSSADIPKVKAAIQDYVKKLNVQSSVPIAYATGNMTSLDSRLGSVDFGIFNRYLAEYIVAFEDLAAYRETVRRVLRSQAAQRLTDSDRKKLEAAFDQAGSISSGIVEKALGCRDELNRRVNAVTMTSKPKGLDTQSIQCLHLTSAELTMALPTLPNTLPFTVKYFTDIYGVPPTAGYLYLIVEGRGLQEAYLVGGYSAQTKQNSGQFEVLKIEPLSDGGQRIKQDFDLQKLRMKAPVAVAVKLVDGFTDFYELTIPDVPKAGLTATSLPLGESAIKAAPDAEIKVMKLERLR
jgi:hypothetical protein